MIIQGSINHTYSGRRRKTQRVKKVKHTFQAAEEPLFWNSRRNEASKYPSAPLTKYTPQKDTSYRQEESRKHTIAIAYNKGGYMVISQDNIKDIGK